MFLNSRWITANLALAKDLAGDPLFELANHGTSHRPLSVTGKSAYGITGTGNPGEVYDEIMTNNDHLTELTGQRPPLLQTRNRLYGRSLRRHRPFPGPAPVGFTINGDAGATLPAATVTREITRARATDIVIAHGNQPSGAATPGLTRTLKIMKDRGETFLPLPRASST